MDKFYIVINNSKKDSWSEIFWSEVKENATIYLDNSNIKNKFLKTIKKYHFSNKINNKLWIPFKFIWDQTYLLKYDKMDENNRNFIIFQSNVKFSPQFIKKIKKKKNATIVLYLPDTIKGIGIGNSKKELDRYKKYYCIDYIYSLDKEDCKKYDLNFFDVYSKIEISHNDNSSNKLFYVGNCRNKGRLQILIKIFEYLKDYIRCNIRLVGVNKDEQKYVDEIIYNSPISYREVIENVCDCSILLEIMNEGQIGNTLRFKEAVCYNKKILTNNKSVLNSKFYDKRYVQYFKNVEDIDKKWILNKETVDYGYDGEFSPKKLLNILSNLKNDKG